MEPPGLNSAWNGWDMVECTAEDKRIVESLPHRQLHTLTRAILLGKEFPAESLSFHILYAQGLPCNIYTNRWTNVSYSNMQYCLLTIALSVSTGGL